MKHGAAAAFVSLYYASIATAASVPRGVGPEFAKFFTDTQTFTCISSPSIRIPFSQVNDDYCDCPDGSDEPGTSACAHLSPLSPHTEADPSILNTTLALPGFYCANKGHRPAYVSFTNVNDGVCDYQTCCDGSEEWEGVGGVKCKNQCDEIGKEWRKQDAVRQRSLSNAVKKRAEMVIEAKKLRQVVVDRMQSLGTEIEGAELRVKQMESELAEIQRTEAAKGGRKGGRLTDLVEVARKRMDDLRHNLLITKVDRDDYKKRLGELEAIMATFKEEYNPNFNDEGVKRAVRAWEDYVASKKEEEDSTERDSTLDKLVGLDKDNGLDWDDYQSDDEGFTQELELLYSFEAYLPPFLRSWLDQKLRDLRTTLITNGILADNDRGSSSKSGSSSDSSESQKVKDARGRVDAAKQALEGHQRNLEESKTDLATDYGADDVFRALKGVCISTDAGEYTYELCFWDRTKQKPKKGGGDTTMGSFTRLDSIVVDDELPSDGKGLGSGVRVVMKHENGQHCWNGPNRSTTVVLACSEENAIWKIMEEEKCVYRMEVGTPAVCPSGGKEAEEAVRRDEL